MNIINKNIIHPNVTAAQLTDGINLSRKEFASVGIVVRNLAKKHGEGKFQDETLLVNDFRAEMRQIFDVHITFEDLKTKDDKPSSMKIVACRFKKKRPLIFWHLNFFIECINDTFHPLSMDRNPNREFVVIFK